MMSQNRAAERAKVEADIDYAINYKVENDSEVLKYQLHRMERKLERIEQALLHEGPASPAS